MPAHAAILSSLAQAMSRQDSSLPLAGRLCAAAVSILGADGAAVTVAYTARERVTLYATDDVAARLEDLQEVLGEGPGHLAFATGRRQVFDVGPGIDDRWPQFSTAAHQSLGPLRVVALPVRPDHEVLGVLTCHVPAGRPLALGDEPSQFLSDAVGAALMRDPHAADTDLSGPWAERAEIHQATGMVVAQLHIDVEDAMALLRAHAFAAEAPLAQIARDVVARRLDFRTEDRPTES